MYNKQIQPVTCYIIFYLESSSRKMGSEQQIRQKSPFPEATNKTKTKFFENIADLTEFDLYSNYRNQSQA